MGTKWQTMFQKEDLEAGKLLFQSGKAKKLVWDEDTDSYSATVRDDRNYHIRVDFAGGKVYTSECDCSDWTEEHACRHVAAAVHLIEQEESDIDMLGGEWPEDIFEEDKPAKKDSKQKGSKAGIPGDALEPGDDFFRKNPQYHPDLTQGLRNLKQLRKEAEENQDDESGEEDAFV